MSLSLYIFKSLPLKRYWVRARNSWLPAPTTLQFGITLLSQVKQPPTQEKRHLKTALRGEAAGFELNPPPCVLVREQVLMKVQVVIKRMQECGCVEFHHAPNTWGESIPSAQKRRSPLGMDHKSPNPLK